MAPDDPLVERFAAAVEENLQLRKAHQQTIEQLRALAEERIVAAEVTRSLALLTEQRAVKTAVAALRMARL
jgi:hypothetical protein